MQVELNLETSSSKLFNAVDLLELAHAVAVDGDVKWREVQAEYAGPDGVVSARAYVVAFDAIGPGYLDELKGIIYRLAAALEQDCIAVYFPEARKGELIGPRAAKWGEFSSEFFNRF